MNPSLWVERAASAARRMAAFAWPERCPACGGVPAPASLLCEPCLERIPRLALPLCARCLAREAADPVCTRHAGFQVWPAWIYEERSALVIEALKYGQRTDLSPRLARELARVVPPGFAADAIVAVPLHPARERERGFNQSARIAESLADLAGVPVATGALERVRPTPAQARLGPAARRRNLRGAFRVPRPGRWRRRRMLVVDDVITTGATLDAALETLRSAGIEAQALAVAWAQ